MGKRKIHNSSSFLLISLIYLCGIIISLAMGISIEDLMKNYQYNVLIIMIAMELFTGMISETGIMEFLALRFAKISKGNRKSLLILFGILMFLISAFLNNITAVMMILPIIFVLLKTIGIDKKYLNIFFATILALSNTGGASSPIGDFPAIVIMSSGITSFLRYLLRAFPFFLLTSIVLLLWWRIWVRESDMTAEYKKLSIDLLQSKYKNLKINKTVFIGLISIFFLMFLSWSFIPSKIMPPEVIALFGCVIAILFCSSCNKQVLLNIDFKPILTISSFLFLASVVSATGILDNLASWLQISVSSPKLLLIVIMIITSIISGLVGAAPAASAMMPVIINLCNNTFIHQSDWVAIAYASSICAGSSLFLWSATAGFILSKKIQEAGLYDNRKNSLIWNIKDYLKYGFANYLIQLIIAIVIIIFIF